MIQRIQTIYLLLVVVLLTISLCLPIGYFAPVADLAEESSFVAIGVNIGGKFYSTWGLFVILLLSAIIAFSTIFLYKKRVLQIRISIFNSLLILGYYISFVIFYFSLKDDTLVFRVSWATCLPLITIILNILAIRAIGRDEVLVKAADRLR